jgi:hypothetical protein
MASGNPDKNKQIKDLQNLQADRETAGYSFIMPAAIQGE